MISQLGSGAGYARCCATLPEGLIQPQSASELHVLSKGMPNGKVTWVRRWWCLCRGWSMVQCGGMGQRWGLCWKS